MTKNNAEAAGVLCVPVSWAPDPLVEGSEQRSCVVCGQAVWASPGTLASVRAGTYPADAWTCLECAVEPVDDSAGPEG